MGSIRAAENLKSPAIIEIFPWSMHFQGQLFIEFIAKLCHSASVPIALHLDHCLEEEDVDMALNLPFDSIMVDGSRGDPEENIAFVAKIVGIAKQKGITIEAELGRIQGGEDGVPPSEMEGLYTNPDDASHFVDQTGVHFLAPSFGNVHGGYPAGGPRKFWEMDRLQQINERVNVPLVLHGVYPVVDDLIQDTVKLGIRKVNLNKNLYDPYLDYISENIHKGEMISLQTGSVEQITLAAEKNIRMLGSEGQAN